MLSKDAKRFKSALRTYLTEHAFYSLDEYYQLTFYIFFTSLINRELFNYNFNLYIFLLLSLFILCIYIYCTILLLYCSITTNALHTYVDCHWFHICKDLWKVNKYDMICRKRLEQISNFLASLVMSLMWGERLLKILIPM